MFVQLLPGDTGPVVVPAPDLIACAAIAWALRRPRFVPPVLIALVVLLEGALFQRPLGLWAAIMVLACEALRTRHRRMRDAGFLTEWALAAGVLLVATLADRLGLLLVMADLPPLWIAARYYAVTALAYPLVVLVSAMVFNVRRLAPGEVSALGHRL